ncbi:MAG TPA: hypothetical protein PK156_10110 [Polyangium sp.]|nr:hypothetical protein [Polyangium sp.]
MRNGWRAVFSSLLLITSSVRAAHEEGPPEATGIQAALRIGYAHPLGSFESGWSEIYETFREQIPITLDVGTRIDPNLYLGGFLAVAPGGPGVHFEALCARRDCTALGVRFGANLIRYFRPQKRFNPWFGFGIGGDISSFVVGEADGNATFSVRGVEFAILSVGGDIRISRKIGFGPYLQYAFGVYTHHRVSTPRYTHDEFLHEKEVHGWLTAGIRVVLFP